jgi:Putative bacterial sensory transduction regulator
MGFVETFGHAMILAFLEDSELHYLRDRDGDFVVEFGYDEEVLGHPRFMLIASGDDHEQYCIRGDTLKRIPKADWDRVMRLCNEWNALYKLPKVYLEIDDPNASASGKVVCEQWINLQAGIHQELINQMTSTFFTASFGFWRWLERQDALHSLGDDVPSDTLPDDDE